MERTVKLNINLEAHISSFYIVVHISVRNSREKTKFDKSVRKGLQKSSQKALSIS